MTSRIAVTALALGTLVSASLVAERSALACGGLFCSTAAPVNQAAERIIFVQNDDDTVTAVIQIMYQGPSASFSWLLPISSVPKSGEDIGIASDIAFQRLQSATNPQYTLTTRIEGDCLVSPQERGNANSVPGATAATGGTSSGATPRPAVTVEASGVVGAFEWEAISLNPELDDPASAATAWLEANDYEVSPGSEKLLGPYLEDGLYLLALKLKKGSDTGSIRPIVLTYAAKRPMIPIKLTAVAANDDMGVMTWVLGKHRAIPRNYLSLQLNEARINWFNAGATYNDVVSEAADEAGGRGFVTEFANNTSTLTGAVWTQSDQQVWQSFSTRMFSSFSELFNLANSNYGSFSGFWDAVSDTVTLPEGVAFEDFKACPNCYQDRIAFSPSELIAALEEQVIEPVRNVQELIDGSDYITRFYSTLSAAEMTEDPLFGFNESLPTVENLHQAERVIHCSKRISVDDAPWSVKLPQGGTIHGTAMQAQQRIWPGAVDEQPPNAVISQLAESGPGMVVLDNRTVINQRLQETEVNAGARSSDSGGCSIRNPQQAPTWALLTLLGAVVARFSARRYFASKRQR